MMRGVSGDYGLGVRHMDSTQCEVRGGVWVCKECGLAYSMAWRDVWVTAYVISSAPY